MLRKFTFYLPYQNSEFDSNTQFYRTDNSTTSRHRKTFKCICKNKMTTKTEKIDNYFPTEKNERKFSHAQKKIYRVFEAN